MFIQIIRLYLLFFIVIATEQSTAARDIASGNFPLRAAVIEGGAGSPWVCDNPEYVKGRFGDALRFDFWRARLFLKAPGLFNPREGTIQFWACPMKDTNIFDDYAQLISAPSSRPETKYSPFTITIPPYYIEGRSADTLRCNVVSKHPVSMDVKNLAWKKGEWHSIAFRWGENGAALFIDGKIAAEKKNVPVAFDETPEFLSFGGGTGVRYTMAANCIMDEIEISDCVRDDSYIKNYAEAKDAPSPDSHTLVLQHCEKSAPDGYWKMTESYRKKNTQSAVSRSGFLGNYGIFKPGKRPELPFTLVNPGMENALFKVSVKVKDYNGNGVDSQTATIETPAGSVQEKNISPDIATPGWYSYNILVEFDGRQILSEEHSFVILPAMPANILNPTNYFGAHLEGTRKTDLFTLAGIPWERDILCTFSWSRVEPEKGVWDWRAPDFIVKEAKINGTSLVAILGLPAFWAAKQADDKHIRPQVPRDMNEFSDYVFKTVSRYKDSIKYWEILNEPDWSFGEQGDITQDSRFSGNSAKYLEILKTGYEAAKKADPDCVVLSGGFVPHPHLIKYLVANGGCRYFDILGMHRYRPWEDFTKYAAMFNKPYWQTEYMVETPVSIASDSITSLKEGCGKYFFYTSGTSMTHFTKGQFEAHGWEPQPVYFATALCASKLGIKKKSGQIKFDRMERLIDGLIFDRGLPTQTAAIFFNYSGRNKLKISFVPASSGQITITGLMGKTERIDAKKDIHLTVGVDTLAYIEGDFNTDSFRVASFDESELLLNTDFKLLDGDIGIDKLAGMKPRHWHMEKEQGSISMSQDGSGELSISFKSKGGSRPIRVAQNILIATPGYYTLSADFMSKGTDTDANPYLTIYDRKTDKTPWKSWSKLPEGKWQNCSISFSVEDGGQLLGMIFGLDRGKGEILFKNPRLTRNVSPELLAKTVFINLRLKANQSFDDNIAGDGQGGWADLGKTNLSRMQTGLRDFGSELFKVESGDNACIILGSRKNTALPLQVDGIKIGDKLKTLNFLCTAMYVDAGAGESLGSCIVRYSDGSEATIPFIRGKNIDDWFPPAVGKDVRVAENVYTPDGERSIFISKWENPQPDKTIESISLKSSGKALWATLAISGNRQ